MLALQFLQTIIVEIHVPAGIESDRCTRHACRYSPGGITKAHRRDAGRRASDSGPSVSARMPKSFRSTVNRLSCGKRVISFPFNCDRNQDCIRIHNNNKQVHKRVMRSIDTVNSWSLLHAYDSSFNLFRFDSTITLGIRYRNASSQSLYNLTFILSD